MRDELLENFGVKISWNLDLRRSGITGEAADYVLLGGSDAYNLRSVLKTKGRKAIQLTKKGMRVRQDTADKLCKHIVDRVDESMVVIIMTTDNLAYLFETEDVRVTCPKKTTRASIICMAR